MKKVRNNLAEEHKSHKHHHRHSHNRRSQSTGRQIERLMTIQNKENNYHMNKASSTIYPKEHNDNKGKV